MGKYPVFVRFCMLVATILIKNGWKSCAVQKFSITLHCQKTKTTNNKEQQ